jgi:hypothetical protein
MGTRTRVSPSILMVVALSAAALAGCGTFSSPQPEPAMTQPLPPPEIPATIRSSEIVGRWGYAAFHKPEDRPRTETNARGQCRQPFVIGQGPTGGVMMYLADQTELTELRLKGSQGGRNYIGPAGEAGGPQDREIVSFDGRVMVLRYTDPEIAGRYGTGVFVRCAPGPAGAGAGAAPRPKAGAKTSAKTSSTAK